MSELKELFKDIKDIFKSEGVKTDEVVSTTKVENSDEVKEQAFEDVVLEDGSVAQVEPEVIPGAAVVVESEGELLPAPDGQHELADGRTIVTEAGVIIEVIEIEESPEQEAKKEDEEYENDSTLSDEQKREAKKVVESIITEKHFASQVDLEKINDQNVSLSTEFSKLVEDMENLKEAYHKIVDLCGKLVEQPQTEPVKKTKSGFSKPNLKTRDVLSHLRIKK
jgi:hypothetical protein